MFTHTCMCSHTLGMRKFRCTQQSYQAVLPLASRAPCISARHHSGTFSVFSKNSTQWLLIVLSRSPLFICFDSMTLYQLVASQNHWLVLLPNITTPSDPDTVSNFYLTQGSGRSYSAHTSTISPPVFKHRPCFCFGTAEMYLMNCI